jgi:hypothetical protein
MKPETVDLIYHRGLQFQGAESNSSIFDYSQAIGHLARTILLRATFGGFNSSESRTPLEVLTRKNPSVTPDEITPWYPTLNTQLLDRFYAHWNQP